MNDVAYVPVKELPRRFGTRPNRFDAMLAQVAKEGHDVVELPPDEEHANVRHCMTGLRNAIRRTGLPFKAVQRQRRLFVIRTDRGIQL